MTDRTALAPVPPLQPVVIDTAMQLDPPTVAAHPTRAGCSGMSSAAFAALAVRVVELASPQVIVVTSAEPRAGTTTVAAYLALALSGLFRGQVALVEGSDNPALAELLGFDPPVCFSEQLDDHRELPSSAWHMAEVGPTALHIAAFARDRREGRPIEDNGPTLAFALQRFRQAGYRHVVVDAPPVLTSARASTLTLASDGVILTIRAGQSRARDIVEANRRIGRHKLLGTVLTMV